MITQSKLILKELINLKLKILFYRKHYQFKGYKYLQNLRHLQLKNC